MDEAPAEHVSDQPMEYLGEPYYMALLSAALPDGDQVPARA